MLSSLRAQSKTLTHIATLAKVIPAKRFKFFYLILLAAFVSASVDIALLILLARFSTIIISDESQQNFLPGIHIFTGSQANQIVVTAVVTAVIFWLSSLLRYTIKYLTGVLSTEVWTDFADKAYRNILSQNYLFFKRKRSVTLAQKMNRLLTSVSDSVVQPIISIFSNAITSVIIIIGLLFIIGPSAILALILMVASYILTSVWVTPRLRFASRQIIRFSNQRNRAFYDSINSIVDVHLYASEDSFIKNYAYVGEQVKRYEKQKKLFPELPRFIIEPAGITILIFVNLIPVLLTNDVGSDEFAAALTTVVTLLAGILKISPPLQALFRDLNKLRGALPNLEEALDIITLSPKRIPLSHHLVPEPRGMFPRHSLSINNVTFKYSKKSMPVLQKLSLSIPVGSRIAFVGRSGSGKTTVANILLGLLSPQKGSLFLDGIKLNKYEIPAFQANCAVVPQALTLLDTSICQNVAFGETLEELDFDRVNDALSVAQLTDFIDTLPYGMMTPVGENGVKLSGGQRQRLSLARAVYKGAQLLVLDEATSALDNLTESQVMDAIELLGRRCTIVIIAHRMTTIQKCDKIYEFLNGSIVASGTYQELLDTSQSFQALHRLESGDL
tara:strand:+ start:82 stop:1926 length:1845 start_codon:yes stop_codon:yes gene_type:complete